MPRYQVISRGYYQDRLYDPSGKRRTLTTDKAFKKCPSWLKPIKEESAAQRKKREEAEKKGAQEAEKKAVEDKRDIDSAMFIESPSLAGPTETL